MAYIGKEPIVGNFQVCDTISTSATDTFNLLVSSVAVFPETENNVICSLNGVVQKPGSGGGFTISGSTIVFNSALTSADVIDFVILLGSVLSVGTPTDRTVTLAKMSTGTDGNIISYDASGNPVAIATGNDGQVLTSTGAGSPPAFETVAGAVNTPAFEANIGSDQGISDVTTTKVTFNTEVFDSDGCYDHATNYRFTPTTAGKYFVYAHAMLDTSTASNFIQSSFYIYKNGSNVEQHMYKMEGSRTEAMTANIYNISTFNGSSDYVEIYVNIDDSSGTPNVRSGNLSAFGAFKIIGA